MGPTPPHSALVIVNPVAGAGRGESVAARYVARLSESGWSLEVARTERAGHAVELASARGGNHPVVLAAGGDGTLSEVVHGLMEAGHDPTVGVLPSGSASDYALNLGIGTREQALAAVREGHSGLVDVGLAELQGAEGPLRRHFVLTTGTGFSPRVIRVACPGMKRLFGRHCYNVAGVMAAATYRPPRMRWQIDDLSGEERIFNVVVSLAERESGGAPMSPGARLDDGLLWVGIAAGRSSLAGLWAMRLIFSGKHTQRPGFRYASARTVRLESDPPVGVQVDGDVPGRTPTAFSIMPRRLRILRPAPSVSVRPDGA